jgi:homocysteine S-methyltransferase
VPGVTIPQSILDRMERHPEKEEALEEGIAIVREIIRDIKPLITGIQISPPFGRLDTALRILESDSL